MKKFTVKVYGHIVGQTYARTAYYAMLRGAALWNKGDTRGVSVSPDGE